MASGTPLNDEDRAPWLIALNQKLKEIKPAVIACSALKTQYRETLTEGLRSKIVWIDIQPELAKQRVSSRKAHFMPQSLVNSQLDTAELPTNGLVVCAKKPLNQLLEKVNNYIFEQ